MTAEETVVPFVKNLALLGVNRFTPSHVAKEASVDPTEVHGVLEAMARAGDLDARYELVCPNAVCHRTVRVYESIDDVPLGTRLLCSKCGEEIDVDLNTIWVSYIPSQQFTLRVNAEASSGEISDVRDQKKKNDFPGSANRFRLS